MAADICSIVKWSKLSNDSTRMWYCQQEQTQDTYIAVKLVTFKLFLTKQFSDFFLSTHHVRLIKHYFISIRLLRLKWVLFFIRTRPESLLVHLKYSYWR
jgi:hypothetical protein